MDRVQDPNVLVKQAKAEVDKPLGFARSLQKWGTKYDSKYDDYKKAIELYQQAARIFTKQGQKVQAAQVLEQAAELEFRVGRDDYAAKTLTDAASSYGNADPLAKARCLQRVITYCTDLKGDFYRAADKAKTLADVYENELKDKEKALETYQAAADWYGDARPSTKRNILPKIAELASDCGDYPRGAENWEECARTYTKESQVMQGTTYAHLFKAGLCRLLGNDMVAISHAFSSYCQMAPGFQSSVEYQTLSEMVDIIERGEPPEAFKAVSENYWRRKYVDEWRRDPYLVRMFERNQAEVKERPDDFS